MLFEENFKKTIKTKNIGIYLQIIVSISLFIYLFSSVKYKDIFKLLENIDMFYFSIYLILGLVTTSLSSFKWKILCESIGVKVGLGKLISYYFIGYFYNNFLPTSVGGDLVRGFALAKHAKSKSDSFATIFVERYTGLLTLVLFVSVAVLLDKRLYGNFLIITLAVILIGSFILGSLLVFQPKFLQIFERIFRWEFAKKISKKARSFQESIYFYRDHKKTLAFAMFWSAVYYLATVITTYFGLKSFHVEITWHNVVLAVPIMLMIFLLPISLGGLGLQEWAHAFVFSLMGVPASVGVGLGLLFRFRALLYGGVGGLASFWTFGKTNFAKNLI